TASDGPDGYLAHGAPPAQNDNGTITPTAPASSIAFAPEVAIPALHNLYDTYGDVLWGPYGFKDAFNLSRFWFGNDYIGIDQGPIVIMIENYLNERVWDRFMTNPYVQTGLARAGFQSVVAVGDGAADATRLVVDQNMPNPFRGTATIAYRLAEPGQATLRIYDLRGRCLRTVVADRADKGPNQITLDAGGLPSGVYLYSIEAGNNRVWRRCVVIR
ncbi:MAG: glucoamylase family protein, partial [Candidatus Krumholzibacteria bacterium]|nr:glucoamylase family protein [Candidatus Krumholzibacteria bacterium]